MDLNPEICNSYHHFSIGEILTCRSRDVKGGRLAWNHWVRRYLNITHLHDIVPRIIAILDAGGASERQEESEREDAEERTHFLILRKGAILAIKRESFSGGDKPAAERSGSRRGTLEQTSIPRCTDKKREKDSHTQERQTPGRKALVVYLLRDRFFLSVQRL